ncbi:hypothetical protein QBC33DRAFT_253227 [Phialemonium atrogriseum]|uniref:Rhodopsin domain-containing protein n=1 Tax=Phialemonium atrogriseum TaxID=1093897 RepID=A0AAJ0BVL4_9PEZI|nr:uncharacterized protein QBC33DRAFT_253227 [Phialemonium atrogriseum]KAK1762891.1 hypothetical protein QBC33DRAFT_253227 [Phialemonium atrogriseum]
MSSSASLPSASSTPPPEVTMLPSDGDRTGTVIAASVVFWFLGAVAVSLRFYARAKIVRVLGAEDWTMLGSLFFATGVSVVQIIMTTVGWGTHVWTIPSDNFIAIQKLTLSLILVYQISLVFTKMSILFLYLRILTYHHARWAVYALMAVVIIYNLWGIISELTVCTPLEKLFQMEEYDACHPVSFTWASVALHIATDFLIFFLPIPVFFRLKMPAREKITVVILFSLGFFACVISILRAVWVTQQARSQDVTWDFVPISVWNVVEVNMVIFCACGMTYKPLIAKFWPRWFTPPEKSGDVSPSDNGQ